MHFRARLCFLAKRGVSHLTSASTIIPPSVFRLTDPGVFSLNGKRELNEPVPPRTLAWFINAIVNDLLQLYNVISILTIEDRATLVPETMERVHAIIFTFQVTFSHLQSQAEISRFTTDANDFRILLFKLFTLSYTFTFNKNSNLNHCFPAIYFIEISIQFVSPIQFPPILQ